MMTQQKPTPRHHVQQNGKNTPVHWRELYDSHSGRLLRCRPPGAPAGAFPHTPFWHCMFHDPYERLNFWSHAVPGLIYLGLALAVLQDAFPGGAALALFSACACVTHMLSALTHLYPDSHRLEKCDHIGIVVSIVGTAVTALMAQEHGHVPPPLLAVSGLLFAAAFLKPLPRVVGFLFGAAVLVGLYGHKLLNTIFLMELILYVAGALFFLRNDGHSRGVGFSDHHLLHYFVTVASALHVVYILKMS